MIGMRKMDNRGMMTVEAACIVPIILMIIVIEIFFGIFLIDISSVKSETIRLADETADVWKTDGNLDRKSTRLNSSHVCQSRMPSSA